MPVEDMIADALRDALALVRAIDTEDPGVIDTVRRNLSAPGVTALYVATMLRSRMIEAGDDVPASLDQWQQRLGL